MSWGVVIAVAIGILVCLFPVVFVWYLNLGSFFRAPAREAARKVVAAREKPGAAIAVPREEGTPARRVAYAALFILAAILMPILIWVALVIAIRKPLLQVVRRVAYAVAFFLASIFMPFLIWAGFGVAVKQWVQKRRLERELARTIGEILEAAGLKIQWGAPADKALVAVFEQPAMSQIQGLLARAGLWLEATRT